MDNKKPQDVSEGIVGQSASTAGLAGDSVWDIYYHDGYGEKQTRVRAHCRHCAWCRFERQNDGCRISVVMPANVLGEGAPERSGGNPQAPLAGAPSRPAG